MTTLERTVQDGIRAAQTARALRDVIQRLLDSGAPPDLMQAALQGVYETFTERGEFGQAEMTLDAMDILAGWCGPCIRVDLPNAS